MRAAGARRDSRRRAGAAGLALLGAAAVTAGTPTEREVFDEAETVLEAKVYRLGAREDMPGSTRAAPYEGQLWWVKPTKVFKGRPPDERFGYYTVLAPLRVHHRSPEFCFPRALTASDLPPDEPVLLYLAPLAPGAKTLLRGRHGLFRFPGVTRMAKLEEWSKAGKK